MRKQMVSLLYCTLTLVPLGARAQDDQQQQAERRQHEQAVRRELYGKVPGIIAEGLDQLRHNYYDDAEKQIHTGSRLPANGNLAAAFRANHENDGQYLGFDVVSVQTITPRLRVIYLALEYERAPHFLKFTVYNGTADGWKVLRLSWLSEDIFETVPILPAQSDSDQ